VILGAADDVMHLAITIDAVGLCRRSMLSPMMLQGAQHSGREIESIQSI